MNPEISKHLTSNERFVTLFAKAMLDKLARAEGKGKSGWQEGDTGALSANLRECVEKGDPVDVANYCMFLWAIGTPILKDEWVKFDLEKIHSKGTFECPICGKETPHEHASEDVARHRSLAKNPLRQTFEKFMRRDGMDITPLVKVPDEYFDRHVQYVWDIVQQMDELK